MVMFLTAADGEFDLGALIPSLESVMGWMDLLMRLLVLAGPLALLGFGLFFFLNPPTEANFTAGYRFRYGMSKVAVWQWMQRLAGMVYGGLGLVMTVVFGVLCIFFGAMEPTEMVWTAFWYMVVEVVLIGLATLGINIAVMSRYDAKGNLRKK